MKQKIFTANAFAKSAGGGNEAGVVLDADCLSEARMGKIAAALGFSETAFVMNSKLADYRVRFFTPTGEVDLCGHATVGTFFTLASLGYIGPGRYTQETGAGILGIEVNEDMTIMMSQPVPSFNETVGKEEIADCLNITAAGMPEDLPVQIVTAGLRDMMVPIKDLCTLLSIRPDTEKITQLSKKYGIVGCHAFTLEAFDHTNASCRNFAPLYGIPEESATGTSNGMLGCYLYKYGIIDSAQAGHILFEQGHSMKKPSEIVVSLDVAGKDILRLRVGGEALNLSATEIEV